MENNENITPQEAAIQNLLGQFLKVRTGGNKVQTAKGPHPDHDSLATFTEGVLSEREARPIVSHLVDCSFCRHVTAELIRLDLAFAEIPMEAAEVAQSEPTRVSEVLSGLLSRIFGTTDGAVFAHNEKDPEAAESKEESTETDDKN
ncbi:MAG TPA: hypothetical protein PKD26_08080 [Pyrinomonadaceae bacterium]|nr:hypothetical protein [Pyrinomonadaceae bacterium]